MSQPLGKDFFVHFDMGVEPKIGVYNPKIIHLFIGFFIINHPFWGTTIFGNTHIFPPIP